jgi:hypothetical protein
MWRRDTDNQDIEHQESDRELITINESQMTETGVYQRVCQFQESQFLSSHGTKLSLYYKECYTELHKGTNRIHYNFLL